MKGLFCSKCFTIRSLSSEDLKPVSCDCGNLKGWWINGRIGVARYHATLRGCGFMVGWNNRFLDFVINRTNLTNEGAKEMHDHCTNAPGFLFDKNRMDCWSIIHPPGHSSDTAWATEEELKAVGLI